MTSSPTTWRSIRSRSTSSTRESPNAATLAHVSRRPSRNCANSGRPRRGRPTCAGAIQDDVNEMSELLDVVHGVPDARPRQNSKFARALQLVERPELAPLRRVHHLLGLPPPVVRAARQWQNRPMKVELIESVDEFIATTTRLSRGRSACGRTSSAASRSRSPTVTGPTTTITGGSCETTTARSSASRCEPVPST